MNCKIIDPASSGYSKDIPFKLHNFNSLRSFCNLYIYYHKIRGKQKEIIQHLLIIKNTMKTTQEKEYMIYIHICINLG